MRKYRKKVLSYAKKYSPAIVAIGTILILGCALGVLGACFIGQDKFREIENIADLFKATVNINYFSLFKELTKEYLILFFLVWVCSLSTYLIPVSVLTVFIKGVKIGLSSGLLMRSLGLEGFTFIGLNSLMQNFLFIPIFIIFTVFFIQKSLNNKKVKHIKDNKYIIKKFGETCIVILISLFLGGFEGYFISLIN